MASIPEIAPYLVALGRRHSMDAGIRRPLGFSLIELLVVLSIIAILATVGVSQLSPNTPRAVRVGLSEMKGMMLQAKSFAVSSGRSVVAVYDTTKEKADYYLVNDNLSLGAAPLGSMKVNSSWRRYANLRNALPIVAGESTSPKGSVPPSLFPADGWDFPMNTTSGDYGFSPSGVPFYRKRGGTPTLENLPSGFWIGVLGHSGASGSLGPPYGVVVITPVGHVVSYYKADSKRDTPQENLWKRLD